MSSTRFRRTTTHRTRSPEAIRQWDTPELARDTARVTRAWRREGRARCYTVWADAGTVRDDGRAPYARSVDEVVYSALAATLQEQPWRWVIAVEPTAVTPVRMAAERHLASVSLDAGLGRRG